MKGNLVRVAVRLGVVTAAIAATTAVAGSPAYAAPSPVVWVDGTVLHFHYNDWPSGLELKIYPAGGAWIVDADVVLAARSGCRTSDSGVTAICMGPVERVEARFGPGDDRLDLDPDALRPDVTHLLIGGKGDDTLLGGPGSGGLLGGPGNDYLDGRGGDDTLLGDEGGGAETGADVMIGGPGHDIVDYLAHPVGIHASLDGVSSDDGGPGEGDTLSADIEELWGTCFDDVLIGNGLDNFIRASGGADRVWGLGGNDSIIPDAGCGDADAFWPDYVDGGPGSDTLLYRNNTTIEVYIDLDDQFGDDGHVGEHDSYVDMENIDSWAAGSLTGNDEDNVIIGGAVSANFIYGLGGRDTLGGGYAGDVIDGGAGDDTLLGDHPERAAPPSGGGADFLFGGAGDDYLDAGSNGMHVEGGAGWDTCVATTDVLSCEVVI